MARAKEAFINFDNTKHQVLCFTGNKEKKNLALEVLRKLISGEIKSRPHSHVVKTKAFSERLAEAMMEQQGKDGLSEDEVTFYEALSEGESAVDVMGDKKLLVIAHELPAISSPARGVRNAVPVSPFR